MHRGGGCVGENGKEGAVGRCGEFAAVGEVGRGGEAREKEFGFGKLAGSGIAEEVVEGGGAGGVVAHESVEVGVGADALGFLVDELAVLGNGEDDGGGGRRDDGFCEGFAVGLLPGGAVVGRVGKGEVVVGFGVGGLADNPGYVEDSGLVGDAVDIGVVFLALEVLSYTAPLTCAGRVAVEVRVPCARLADAKFHEQVSRIDAFETWIRERCEGSC